MRERDKHYPRESRLSRREPGVKPSAGREDDPAYEWGHSLGEKLGKDVVELIKNQEGKLGRSMTLDERQAFLAKHGSELFKWRLVEGIGELFEPKKDD